MPIPLIVYGIAALGFGLFASGCASSSNRAKSPDEEEGDSSCRGKEYSIKFGDKTAYTLCHEGDNGDGVYQADSEILKIRDDLGKGGFLAANAYQFMDLRRKLNLPFFDGKNLGHFQNASRYLSFRNLTPFGERETKIFNRLLEYCESHRVDLGRAIHLAEKIQTASGVNSPLPDMSSSVKLNVILLTASLLSLEGKQEKPQFKKYQGFIQGTLEQIEAGKLTIADLSKRAEGPSVANQRAVNYFPELDKYLLSGEMRVDSLAIEASVMMHELYHFYQDFQAQPISFSQSEGEAFLLQANMLLDDHGLFRENATKEDLNKFVNQSLIPSGLSFHPNDPLFHALILQFLKNQEGEGSQIKPGQEFDHAMLEQFFDAQVSGPVLVYLKSSQKNPSVERFFNQYRFTKETNEAEIKEKLFEYLGFLSGSRDQKFHEFDQNFSNPGSSQKTWNSSQQKKATELLGGIFQDTTDLMVLTILMQAYDPQARENEEELMKKGQEIKKKTLDRLVRLEVLDKLLVPYDGFQ